MPGKITEKDLVEAPFEKAKELAFGTLKGFAKYH